MGSWYICQAVSTVFGGLIQQMWVVDDWAGPLANMTLLTGRPEYKCIAIEQLFKGKLACGKSNYAAERKPGVERKPG